MSKKRVETNNVQVRSNKKLFTIGGVVAAFFLILFVIMIFENTDKYQLTVENNTGKKLEYVKLKFSSMDTAFDSDVFFNQELAANQTIIDQIPKLNLYMTEARLYVVFKFEGEEEETAVNGWFNSHFNGQTQVVFGEKDGITTLDVKIKQGFFDNSNYNECDEHWEYEF